jgi:hypothetical protein
MGWVWNVFFFHSKRVSWVGCEGLAIFKGRETKFDSFCINSIYLITNLDMIIFISNYFNEKLIYLITNLRLSSKIIIKKSWYI